MRSGALDPFSFLLYADSSGPASAWADREIKAYVPSRYAVCARDPAEALTLLPDPAADLLRGKEKTYEHSAGQVAHPHRVTCFEVTTDEARALAHVLRRAGFEAGKIGSVGSPWVSRTGPWNSHSGRSSPG